MTGWQLHFENIPAVSVRSYTQEATLLTFEIFSNDFVNNENN